MKKVIDALHHWFLPKHTNNYRAKFLHHDLLTLYLVFALAVTAGVYHFQKKNGSILGYATDISVNKLHTLVNEERTKENLPALKYNTKLAEAAKKKAEDMFAKNYWSHYGPAGETPWDFILDSGYQYEYAGENLAKNFLFSEGVIKGWMDSKTHRENIVRPEYTDVGYAVVNGILNGEETTLIVQEFGKPLNPGAEIGYSTDNVPSAETAKLDSSAQKETSALGQSARMDKPARSFLPLYLNLNLVFFIILILALTFDFYFAAKLNIISLKGKNLIHILFIAFISIGLLIAIKGALL